MPLWLAFVDLIRTLLLSLAHVAGGSVGSGIFALSILVRPVMLPLAVKAALRARESAERLRALEPELRRLRERKTGIAASIASLAVVLAPSNGSAVNNRWNALVMGLITVVIAWRLASGVGLYWVGSNAVGVAQSLIVRRITRRAR